MTCPFCGFEITEQEDGRSACEDCGFILYGEYDLAAKAEAFREYNQAKSECYPNPVPSYREYQAGKRGE
jgi:hypothetical protein